MARSGIISMNRAAVILSELEKSGGRKKIYYSDLKSWFGIKKVGASTLLEWQTTLYNNGIFIKWNIKNDGRKCYVEIDPKTDLTKVARQLSLFVTIPGFTSIVNSIYKRELGISHDILVDPSKSKFTEFQRAMIKMDLLKDTTTVRSIGYLKAALESMKTESLGDSDIACLSKIETEIHELLSKLIEERKVNK